VLERAGKRITVKLAAAVLSNNGRALQEAGRAGVGIFIMPSIGAIEDVPAGMGPLLLDWAVLPRLRLYALYPHRRFVPAKVRLFVETLREDLGDPERDPFWPAITAAGSRKPRSRG
jgi:DNA-binding transcriptional LysR family regulator